MADGMNIADSLARIVDLIHTGQFVAAETRGRELTQAAPRDPTVWHQLALVYLDQRKAAEAEESIVHAIALAPDVPQYWNILSAALGLTDRLDEAEWYARRTLQLDSKTARYWLHLAALLAAQGQQVESVEAHQQAIALARG